MRNTASKSNSISGIYNLAISFGFRFFWFLNILSLIFAQLIFSISAWIAIDADG